MSTPTHNVRGPSRTRRGQQYGTLNHNIPANTSYPSRCHIGPPPPYTGPTSRPAQSPFYPRTPVYDEDSESVQESASLLGTNSSKKRDKNRASRLIVLLFCVLMFVAIWSIVPIMSVAIELETEEWQRLHKQMVLDIGELRAEKRNITDEVQLLRYERDAMRRRWENEREANEQRRRGHLPFWGEPRLTTAQCPKDRFRRYEARMYNLLVEDDWYVRCMNEPVQIAGRRFTSPGSCINYGLDDGVRGYWTFEVNRRECPRTIWDRLRNIFR
ncbi:hypothetical protein EDB85DRAFT_1906067 [Lactarius pseudohatsudake]|nr:hypothetical protein EDB85DRAFT_1906067 [Lactarius pseudohatsudake]